MQFQVRRYITLEGKGNIRIFLYYFYPSPSMVFCKILLTKTLRLNCRELLNSCGGIQLLTFNFNVLGIEKLFNPEILLVVRPCISKV